MIMPIVPIMHIQAIIMPINEISSLVSKKIHFKINCHKEINILTIQ